MDLKLALLISLKLEDKLKFIVLYVLLVHGLKTRLFDFHKARRQTKIHSLIYVCPNGVPLCPQFYRRPSKVFACKHSDKEITTFILDGQCYNGIVLQIGHLALDLRYLLILFPACPTTRGFKLSFIWRQVCLKSTFDMTTTLFYIVPNSLDYMLFC